MYSNSVFTFFIQTSLAKAESESLPRHEKAFDDKKLYIYLSTFTLFSSKSLLTHVGRCIQLHF